EKALSVQAASWLAEASLHDWSQRTTEPTDHPGASLIGPVPVRRTVLKHAAFSNFTTRYEWSWPKHWTPRLAIGRICRAPKPRSCTGDMHLGCALANRVILTGHACSRSAFRATFHTVIGFIKSNCSDYALSNQSQ